MLVIVCVSVRCGLVRDVHWFEVTEKLRESHPAYTGPSDGLQSAESHRTVFRLEDNSFTICVFKFNLLRKNKLRKWSSEQFE